ncbi:uncharacterized protein F4817DRAFT_24 [Daldinia loculata]|uniref:uncharacterized protein n=1 Tax=Daldinia loculata TaxID=103429 RepID=UPI0020C4FD7D|nr:uncharacterized protein F4817DRAFT_24 [Daldinia loculata]KAI1652001.1 hypothetical protein F4817DRAFT_24 [Daldinia loculata]
MSSNNPHQTSGNQPNPSFSQPQPNNAGNEARNNQSPATKRTKRADGNSIPVQPADHKKDNVKVLARYFTTTAGLSTMTNNYISTHAPDTKTLALFITLPKENPGQSSGDHIGVKLLPFDDDLVVKGSLKRKADDRTLCANCRKDTHVLADCVWPVHRKWGDIFGCPICNTKDHRFDYCHSQPSLDDWARFELLVLRRAGKCMIRSDCEVYKLALQFIREGRVNPAELTMPWTRSGAVALFDQPEAVATLEAWHYQNPRAQVVVDPNSTPAALDGLATLTGGDFTSFCAAARRAEKEQKAQARQHPQPAQPGAPNKPPLASSPLSFSLSALNE